MGNLGYLRLRIAAGQAKMGPPVGPALGQRSLSAMEFSKQFNHRTQEVLNLCGELPLTVKIYELPQYKFRFTVQAPSVTSIVKAAQKDLEVFSVSEKLSKYEQFFNDEEVSKNYPFRGKMGKTKVRVERASRMTRQQVEDGNVLPRQVLFELACQLVEFDSRVHQMERSMGKSLPASLFAVEKMKEEAIKRKYKQLLGTVHSMQLIVV